MVFFESQYLIVQWRLSEGVSQTFLELFVSHINIPVTLIEHLVTKLISHVVPADSSEEFEPISRRLLALVHQRFPKVLRKCADALMEEDETLKGSIEQLLLSLNTVSSNNNWK